MNRKAEGFQARYFSAQDGLRLYYRDYPGPDRAAGTPLLCLSGVARNSKDFHRFALRQARRRRVVCLDYRGRGRSAYDPTARSYDPPVYLRDVAALLTAAHLRRPAVVGTSLGGLIGLGLAAYAPTALAGLVLNDIGPELSLAYAERLLPYIGQDDSQPDLAAATAHLKALFPEIGFRTDEVWTCFAEGTYHPGEDGRLHVDWDTAIARALKDKGLEVPNLWPLFGAIRAKPALALRGSRSPLLSAETFARMQREKPDLCCVVVEGLGHAPSLEEEEADEAIDDFLRGLDG